MIDLASIHLLCKSGGAQSAAQEKGARNVGTEPLKRRGLVGSYGLPRKNQHSGKSLVYNCEVGTICTTMMGFHCLSDTISKQRIIFLLTCQDNGDMFCFPHGAQAKPHPQEVMS